MSFRRESFLSRYKALIIVCTGAILTGVISFMITVKVYDNNFERNLNNSDNRDKVVTDLNHKEIDEPIIAKGSDEKSNDSEKENNNIEVISDEAAGTIEEYMGENEIQVVEIAEEDYNEFITLLARNEEEKNIPSNVIETVANIEKESGEEAKKEEKEIHFMLPLEGEIGLNYSTEKLIYSNTLEEWITHNGIDIIGEEADPVKAIESGVVESVKMDPRYGNTIIINHNEEYKSIYSNLSTQDLVYVGKKIEKGEIISGVGAGFGFESKEKPHVHLTILKNGESINPEEIIK